MGSTLIEAAVVLILGLALIAAGKPLVGRYITVLERRQIESEEGRQLAIRERAAAIELTEATAEERAELERAQLARRATEERTRASIATDPRIVGSQTEGELEVIAARTAARVTAAHEYDGADDAAVIGILKTGYDAYLEHDNECNFSTWLNGANVRGLSLAALEKLIDAYVAYVEQDNEDTFGDWFRGVDPHMFQ